MCSLFARPEQIRLLIAAVELDRDGSADVRNAVRALYTATWPGEAFTPVARAFLDLELAFADLGIIEKRLQRMETALDAFLDTMAGNTAVDPATRDALALLSKQVSVPHGVDY